MQADEIDTISVVLADDHDLVRSGIRALLETVPSIRVVGEARDGEELLAFLASRPHPDVVITDLAMPQMDGLDAITRIRERYPELRILVVSASETAEFVKQAVANGANGYLMKGAPSDELARALRQIVQTGSYFSSSVAQLLLQRQEPTAEQQLTSRQIEILTLLARGLSSKEIAYELGLSSKTVDVHRSRIMQRLGITDLASLTRYAVRNRLVKP
ncbi:response regulator [Ramlibacter sp. MMS24-I3-19]|uniref:response regulator n=1 Tax=Ramlibacter sp. MMS24-I3-19 TaxID=3416606 RepID=UPI003CFCC761